MGRFTTDNKSFRMFSVQIIPKWIENVHVNFGILCISIILDMIGTNIQLLVHSALPFICSIAHLGPDHVQLNCRNKSKLLTESNLWISVFLQNWVYQGQVQFSFVCYHWLFPPMIHFRLQFTLATIHLNMIQAVHLHCLPYL